MEMEIDEHTHKTNRRAPQAEKATWPSWEVLGMEQVHSASMQKNKRSAPFFPYIQSSVLCFTIIISHTLIFEDGL